MDLLSVADDGTNYNVNFRCMFVCYVSDLFAPLINILTIWTSWAGSVRFADTRRLPIYIECVAICVVYKSGIAANIVLWSTDVQCLLADGVLMGEKTCLAPLSGSNKHVHLLGRWHGR